MERFHAVFPELSPSKVVKWDRSMRASKGNDTVAPQLESLKCDLQHRLGSICEHRRQQEIEAEVAELNLDMVVR